MSDRLSELLQIGTFSHIGRVSARLLRHYHAIGLLVPHTIDDNEYRLYQAAQLTDLHRILALRDLGLSLEEVRDVLADGSGDVELRSKLGELERQAESERKEAEARLRSIQARVRAIDNSLVDEPLQQRTFEATAFQSVAGVYTPVEAREIVRELFLFGTELGLAPPFVAARWTGPFDRQQWPLEIGLAGTGDVDDAPMPLRDSSLPAGSFVTTVRTMAADQAHELYSSVPNYCEAHHLRLTGELREVVYAMPDADSGREPTVEIQFGVQA